MNRMPTATPEQMGIPSHSIERVIRRLEQDQIPMHSLLIARHGKIVFEGYYSPYTPHTLHRMFSITKSFVSLAVGCLEAEGKLVLDDPICGHFPEYAGIRRENIRNPWLTSMTIRHMLEMKSCYSGTTYNKKSTTENWVESFFTATPSHPSGTIFQYDTSASHVLCALVEKLSGMKMLDYLRAQFLDKIGFSKEAYILPDPFGVSMGGSGLMALPSDLMRVGLFLMNGGRAPSQYGNRDAQAVYPQAYLKNAVSFHSATVTNAPIKEESYGYGWQFWRFGHNGFGCYGMGGQLILCYPDEDLICVTTADTQAINGGNQFIYNAIYKELFSSLSDSPLPENRDACKSLNTRRERLALPVLSSCFSGSVATNTDGPAWILDKNKGAFCKLSITFDTAEGMEKAAAGSGGVMTLFTASSIHRYPFTFAESVSFTFEPGHLNAVSSACWLTPHTLYIRIWLVDTSTSSLHFQLDFSGSHLTVQVRKTEESRLGEFQGFWNGELITACE